VIAIFLYGNKVPLPVALAFFIQCCEQADKPELDTLMALVHLEMYGHWDETPSDARTCVPSYYNVQLKKMQNIHPPHPEEVDAIPLGVEATGHSARITVWLTQMGSV
jgi:hypothetical protein